MVSTSLLKKELSENQKAILVGLMNYRTPWRIRKGKQEVEENITQRLNGWFELKEIMDVITRSTKRRARVIVESEVQPMYTVSMQTTSLGVYLDKMLSKRKYGPSTPGLGLIEKTDKLDPVRNKKRRETKPNCYRLRRDVQGIKRILLICRKNDLLKYLWQSDYYKDNGKHIDFIVKDFYRLIFGPGTIAPDYFYEDVILDLLGRVPLFDIYLDNSKSFSKQFQVIHEFLEVFNDHRFDLIREGIIINSLYVMALLDNTENVRFKMAAKKHAMTYKKSLVESGEAIIEPYKQTIKDLGAEKILMKNFRRYHLDKSKKRWGVTAKC